jgi:demethylmenaquinone methyltransferase/2-methoxy-6-polyprenyl-1,4-benzoquinol methylase
MVLFFNTTKMTESEVYYFDNIAPHWDEQEIYSTPSMVNRILDIVGISEGMHVLDLGTGTGVLVPHLLQRVGSEGKVQAIDCSEGMLLRARAKCAAPYEVFVKADFEKERLQGRYHRILMYCVYPHLHRPLSTIKKLVSQNLTNNGTLTIAFPTAAMHINNVHRHKNIHSAELPSSVSLAMHLRAHHIVATATSNNPYVVTVTKR